MATDDQIAAKFNRFAGREVVFTETAQTYKGQSYTEYGPPAQDDPVVREVNEEAARQGVDFVGFVPPGEQAFVLAGWMDGAKPEVAAYTERGQDGKCRISRFSVRSGP